ncbi:MAG: ABC transporter ATP-binding protein [SAR324 cluster bacterium]|uniref:ABC transporter ATP-binding protein n=1 Tax=SAR324 cluster bacterium TaxID=2024889 RepID=A0A2A4T8U7_9DELT|nr:MAG: ABC transporter ATP-binding protein [SAR324 cluster bacterium]
MSFFEVKELNLSFGGVRALRGISFQVAQGELFSIIGPNGSGKTTLFNCINGLYQVDRGELLFQGQAIQGKRPDQVARLGIARTFQNIELFPQMNALENILVARHLSIKYGFFRSGMMWGPHSLVAQEERLHRKKVEEIIDLLELQSVRHLPVATLAYGIRKRVELARALALEPKLLLLDEPSAGLNAEEKEELRFQIHDIRTVLGVTILLIEHDIKLVMEISHHILALDFGKPIIVGTPEVVRTHPEVMRAYLGE